MRRVFPREADLPALFETYDMVPVAYEAPGDIETPVSAYLKLQGEGACFLLESVEGGETFGRFSYIGLNPLKRLTLKLHQLREFTFFGEQEVLHEGAKAARDQLETSLKEVSIAPIGFRYPAGYVGYIAYEYIHTIERLQTRQSPSPDDVLADLLFCRDYLVFDRLKHSMLLISLRNCQEGEIALSKGFEQVKKLYNALFRKRIPEPDQMAAVAPTPATDTADRKKYVAAVRTAKEHIREGDAFQIVLSRRIDMETSIEPFQVYRSLRQVSPAPYLFFLDMGELQLCGASPEALVRVEKGSALVNPIAGTRPRGNSAEDDQRLEEEFLQDEKEKAEHLMLVDLARNDLGRVCEVGSIEVKTFQEVQRFSHVMHLVSTVIGNVPLGMSQLDVLDACFPAGTVSGAPKIRAMEIIGELEPATRGPYAGAVGYLGFDGTMDLCIAIRTLLFRRGNVSVQAGAGVVADSDPESEFLETQHKASALIAALERAYGV